MTGAAVSAGGSDAGERLVHAYRIRFDEATPHDVLRSSVYLAFAQDCAWLHSESLGFTRAWYAERGLTWLVRAVELSVERDARAYEEVAVSTEVTAMRRVWARRRSEFRATPEGELLAVARIDWVMVGDRGLPARIPADLFAAFPGPAVFDPRRVQPGPEPPSAERLAFTVRPRDLDPMAHVNNTVYLDYLEEAVEAAGNGELLRRVPRHFALEYVAPAPPGARLQSATWPITGGLAYRLALDSGDELLRGELLVDGRPT